MISIFRKIATLAIALVMFGCGNPIGQRFSVSQLYKVDMLKLFISGGKKIQWTPLFRERNGKLSGAYVEKYGKIFFYVDYSDELIDWLREMKQAI